MDAELKIKLEKMLNHINNIEDDEVTLNLYNVGRWDFVKNMVFTKDELWVSVNRTGYYDEQEVRVTFDLAYLKPCLLESIENEDVEVLKEGLSSDWNDDEFFSSGNGYFEYNDEVDSENFGDLNDGNIPEDIVDEDDEDEISTNKLSENWEVDNEDTEWEDREFNVTRVEMNINGDNIVIELD